MGELDIALEHGQRAGPALRIAGRLRPGWCGNLSSGLADLGIGIVRGHAVTLAAGVWRAEFELDAVDVAPNGEDLVRLLETEASAGFTTPLQLERHRLERCDARGCLILEVEARDRVGLLAALLRRLAFHSLFPVELRLETEDGVARDRLWLCGAGGATPTARVAHTLGASLDALARYRA